ALAAWARDPSRLVSGPASPRTLRRNRLVRTTTRAVQGRSCMSGALGAGVESTTVATASRLWARGNTLECVDDLVDWCTCVDLRRGAGAQQRFDRCQVVEGPLAFRLSFAEFVRRASGDAFEDHVPRSALVRTRLRTAPPASTRRHRCRRRGVLCARAR